MVAKSKTTKQRFFRKKFVLFLVFILVISAVGAFTVGAKFGPNIFPSLFEEEVAINDGDSAQKTTGVSQITNKTKTALAELLGRSQEAALSETQDSNIFNPDCDESVSLLEAKNCTYVILTDKGHGSGFAISSEFIVTNKHVVNQAKEISSVVDDQSVLLSLWNFSPDADIALLKSEAPLAVCRWADSDQIMLAETLFAIGWPNSPDGESSITKGIFSRFVQTQESVVFIQTDTAINPGNSGGPLVSSCGVAGINTAKISWSQDNVPAEGFSFAIAANYGKQIVEDLINTGKNHQLPVTIPEQEHSFIKEAQPSPRITRRFLTEESRHSWIRARSVTQELKDFWQNPSGEFNQKKLEELRDLIARMQAVEQTVVPKIEKNQSISKEEEQLLQQWIEMHQKAVVIEGELYGRDFSQGYAHLRCSGNSCVLVAGRGKDQCKQAQDCAPKYHYACEGITCTVKEGEGENQCNSHDDCYYYACEDGRCVKKPGNEQDQCLTDVWCQ